MKWYLLISCLFAPAAYALQTVPSAQVPFPTNTYGEIQAATDDAETAAIDLDTAHKGVASNAVAAAANAVAAANAALAESNAVAAAANAADIAAANASLGTNGVTAGFVVAYAHYTAPTNWLECAGTAVSRTTYSNLFSVVGTNFGSGDGSNTFHLPDLRGYFVRGWDNAAGNDPDSGTRTNLYAGGATGDLVGAYQDQALATHDHYYAWADCGSDNHEGDTDEGTDDDYYSPSTGTSGGNEVRPKNYYLMYIIKY